MLRDLQVVLERPEPSAARADRLLRAQILTTRALAEAHAEGEAVERVLEALCRALGWQVGVVWTASEEGLSCSFAWCEADEHLERFCKSAAGAKLPLEGSGAIAYVYATGQAQWLSDVSKHERASDLEKASLVSGVIFPLYNRGDVLGIIELLGRGHEAPDKLLLELVAAIGVQIGSFFRESVSKGEAQRAAKSREDLLAVVSHDLRNPLGVVVMKVGMLLASLTHSERSTKLKRDLEAVQRATSRMKRLIADLLDFASIETGKLSVTSEPQPLLPLIEQSVEAAQLLAANRGQTIEPRVPDESVWVIADRERILQVISNLVGNAIKFSPEGSSIVVGAERHGDQARFFVSDKGPGVNADQMPRLFERYWQGSPRKESVGLGLFICKGIVDAHGGEIWVESVPGEGATFYFTLPVAEGTRGF